VRASFVSAAAADRIGLRVVPGRTDELAARYGELERRQVPADEDDVRADGERISPEIMFTRECARRGQVANGALQSCSTW
jgi:hypothetical protein